MCKPQQLLCVSHSTFKYRVKVESTVGLTSLIDVNGRIDFHPVFEGAQFCSAVFWWENNAEQGHFPNLGADLHMRGPDEQGRYP